MSKVVYLIGHGRVAANKPIVVPATMTMHWLGHLGDVSNGISYAFLLGQLTAELDPSLPSSSILEHYLCGERADEDPVTDTKIKNFFDRKSPHPLGSTNPYVLYPRGKTNVSLSSIFAFLEMLSPTEQWHLYWTCCRGYIGVRNPKTSTYVKKSGLVERLERKPEPGKHGKLKIPKTPQLSEQEHQTVDAGFDTIRLVAQSDYSVVEEQIDEGLSGLNPRARKFATRSPSKAIEALLVKI
ncbi:MAG TPA: hypothetical protein VF730_01050 [Terracidiphilus sp.]